jgi:hypothetical protein
MYIKSMILINLPRLPTQTSIDLSNGREHILTYIYSWIYISGLDIFVVLTAVHDALMEMTYLT